MTETVKRQILAVHDTGLTNMLDTRMVQRLANEVGFYELVVYIEEQRSDYVRFIMTGETD